MKTTDRKLTEFGRELKHIIRDELGMTYTAFARSIPGLCTSCVSNWLYDNLPSLSDWKRIIMSGMLTRDQIDCLWDKVPVSKEKD